MALTAVDGHGIIDSDIISRMNTRTILATHRNSLQDTRQSFSHLLFIGHEVPHTSKFLETYVNGTGNVTNTYCIIMSNNI